MWISKTFLMHLLLPPLHFLWPTPYSKCMYGLNMPVCIGTDTYVHAVHAQADTETYMKCVRSTCRLVSWSCTLESCIPSDCFYRNVPLFAPHLLQLLRCWYTEHFQESSQASWFRNQSKLQTQHGTNLALLSCCLLRQPGSPLTLIFQPVVNTKLLQTVRIQQMQGRPHLWH